MTTPRQRLEELHSRIRRCEQRCARAPGSVELLAVSKTRSAAEIGEIAEAGQQRFGENYLQEALPKIRALTGRGLEWHFIGTVQSNKTRAVAESFAWVHTLEREKIARRLSEQRPLELPALNVCIELNISGEESKSGVAPHALPNLVAAVRALPRLRLRGLMALPAPSADPDAQRQAFARLRRLLDELNAAGAGLDTLSMGTSGDFEAAIAEGATLIRIGTALFGPRGEQ